MGASHLYEVRKIVLRQISDDSFGAAVYINDVQQGEVFIASTHEQLFAWLRLMLGAYPGTYWEVA